MEFLRIIANISMVAMAVVALYVIIKVVPALMDRYEALTELGGYTP